MCANCAKFVFSNQREKVSMINWMNNYNFWKYLEQRKSLLRVKGTHDQKADHSLLVKKHWEEVSIAKHQADLEAEQQKKKHMAKAS